MSFWNSEKIKAAGPKIFKKFDPARISCGAYEMRPRAKALVSGQKDLGVLEGDGKMIRIAPGQFAILVTHEEISVPENVIGLISIKYSHKKKGLVNVSGFHVDPGFHGHLKFSVFNASPKTLYIDPRKPFFQIWFCDMQGEPGNYNGNHVGQDRFIAEEYELVEKEFPSPPVLKDEIDQLKKNYARMNVLLISISAGVVVAIIQNLLL